MKTKNKVLAIVLAVMFAIALHGYSVKADDAKYELNIKLRPTAALIASHPEARVLEYPGTKIEGHADFTSKEECETHFVELDVMGIKLAMFQTGGLREGTDYTIEHECVVGGVGT